MLHPGVSSGRAFKRHAHREVNHLEISPNGTVKDWIVSATNPECLFARPMFNTSFLFASLLWGSVGLGYFIYGKRQGSWIPMVGGVAMMALSYFISSGLLMSLMCIGLMAVIYVMLRRGY